MALICSHAFLIEIAPHTPDLCHPPLTAVCFSFNFISSFNFFFFFSQDCWDTSGEMNCSSRWHLLFIQYYFSVMALCGLIGETLKSTKTHGNDKCLFNLIMFWKTLV